MLPNVALKWILLVANDKSSDALRSELSTPEALPCVLELATLTGRLQVTIVSNLTLKWTDDFCADAGAEKSTMTAANNSDEHRILTAPDNIQTRYYCPRDEKVNWRR